LNATHTLPRPGDAAQYPAARHPSTSQALHLSAPPILIQRPPDALAGPDHFASFVREEHAALCAFLRAGGASAEDAEDMAQDCMERLLRYQAHAPAELRPLLYRIARNRLIDRRRHSPLSAAQIPSARGCIDEPVCAAAGPQRQAESGQLLVLLRQALFTLPYRSREVYLLNRINGMSYAQIAQHCGISAKTVEKHIARALQGLRKELGADAFRKDGDP
jgi:RNA polymerase sigma-70 factor (ECF subfamily)